MNYIYKVHWNGRKHHKCIDALQQGQHRPLLWFHAQWRHQSTLSQTLNLSCSQLLIERVVDQCPEAADHLLLLSTRALRIILQPLQQDTQCSTTCHKSVRQQ